MATIFARFDWELDQSVAAATAHTPLRRRVATKPVVPDVILILASAIWTPGAGSALTSQP
jgi:hypothetical protein